MADSPLKTKAKKKKKKKKRERIAEAVRWVSAILEDVGFGSEDWMVLQGHPNSVGGWSRKQDSGSGTGEL